MICGVDERYWYGKRLRNYGKYCNEQEWTIRLASSDFMADIIVKLLEPNLVQNICYLLKRRLGDMNSTKRIGKRKPWNAI